MKKNTQITGEIVKGYLVKVQYFDTENHQAQEGKLTTTKECLVIDEKVDNHDCDIENSSMQ